MNRLTLLPLAATDILILYPMILVPGRVNGGLHVILTAEELMKECDKPTTDDNGPVILE